MENLYLAHHGVKGMHWGVRRYQNPDGSLKNSKRKKKGLSDKQKRALKIGATAVGAALLAYGTYKLTKNVAENRAFIKTGQEFINNAKLKTSQLEKRVLETDKLLKNDLSFDTFKPETFKPETFKPDSFNIDSFNPRKALDKAPRGPYREGNNKFLNTGGSSKTSTGSSLLNEMLGSNIPENRASARKIDDKYAKMFDAIASNKGLSLEQRSRALNVLKRQKERDLKKAYTLVSR